MIRSQYFFRQSDRGLLAWDVRRLIELSRDFPVVNIPLADISEIDEAHWYAHEGDSPTCRSHLEHMQLIEDVDTRFPIILDRDGRFMDGMHRVCRALRDGDREIPAVQFAVTPDPDYVGRRPDELPYDA